MGAVYELLEARSLAQCIRENPDRLDDYIDISVSLLETIHGTQMDTGALENKREAALRRIVKSTQKVLDAEQYELLMQHLNKIPDGNSMVHGDFHIKNIVMQDGTPMLIDMETIGYGAPILDLGYLHRAYIGFSEIIPDNAVQFFDLSQETCEYIWNRTLRRYYGGEEEATLRRNMYTCALFSYATLIDWVDRHYADTPMKWAQNMECLRERIREQLDLFFWGVFGSGKHVFQKIRSVSVTLF